MPQLREVMLGRILAQIERAVIVRAAQYSKTPKRVWRLISKKLGVCSFGWIYEKMINYRQIDYAVFITFK